MRKRLLIGLASLALTIGVGIATHTIQSFVGGATHIACNSSSSEYCSGGG